MSVRESIALEEGCATGCEIAYGLLKDKPKYDL